MQSGTVAVALGGSVSRIGVHAVTIHTVVGIVLHTVGNSGVARKTDSVTSLHWSVDAVVSVLGDSVHR